MPSYNDKLKCELARRDAAIRAIRGNFSTTADSITGAVQQTKETLRPSHLMEELRTEYNPAKLVEQYPWASLLAAMAAGFVVVPLVRSAVAAIPVQPKPHPQRVIIEVAGHGPVAKTVTDGGATAPSTSEIVMEILALFGGVKGLMERFKPYLSKFSGESSAEAEPASEVKTSPAISRRYAPPPSES